jgi:hypothetical protein
MCGSTEKLPSVAVFYGTLNTTEREIYSGKKSRALLWSSKRKIQRTGEPLGGITFLQKLRHIKHLATTKSFFFHMGHEVFC